MATSAHSEFFIRKLLIVFLLSCFVLVSTGCGDESFTTNTTENNTSSQDQDTDPDPGSGPSPSPSPTPTPPPTPTGSSVASVTLWASASTLGSGSSNSINLTAIAKNQVNNLVEGATISFRSTGGALQVTQDTTSAAGIATAVLTSAGDPTNRRITVTAVAGTITDEIQIEVVGSDISIIGPNSLTVGDNVDYTIQLADSDGNGIAFEDVGVESDNNAILTAAPFITDASGKLTLTLNAQLDGTLTANALDNSVTSSLPLTVTTDQYLLSVTQLGANETEMDIDQTYTVQLAWSDDTGPKVGEIINFSATRGTVTPTSVQTDANGTASVQISSSSSGPTLITADSNNGPSTSLDLEFIAILPDTLTLQAEKVTVGPNGEESALTAIVRDPNDNLVKNQVVRFTILDDTSGGNISNATDTSDSLGRANTIYISSEATSAKDGVWIRAQLDGVTCPDVDQLHDLCADVYLTVAERELFVRLGTSNLLTTVGATRYGKEFNALVTDAAGNAVPNVEVALSVIPTYYYTGCRFWEPAVNRYLTHRETKYANEDLLIPEFSLNGVLDRGEDFNNNGVLDPGNVASVQGTVTTDADGFATFKVIYAKNYAHYIDVLLTASTEVAGTETSDSTEFNLPILLGDTRTRGTVPGATSKWGTDGAAICGQSMLAVSGQNAGEIVVSWYNVPGANSYNIYWSNTPGVIIGSNPITNVTSPYTHREEIPGTSLTPGAIYYYIVTAVVNNNEVLLRSEISAMAQLAAPQVDVDTNTPGQITLQWPNVAGATEYRIYKSDVPGALTSGTSFDIANVVGDPDSFTDTDVTTGTSYYYVVVALNASGIEGLIPPDASGTVQ